MGKKKAKEEGEDEEMGAEDGEGEEEGEGEGKEEGGKGKKGKKGDLVDDEEDERGNGEDWEHDGDFTDDDEAVGVGDQGGLGDDDYDHTNWRKVTQPPR
jgi:X-linked retinitis pigmentosa GTPase regulator